jgi:hypothetical protein
MDTPHAHARLREYIKVKQRAVSGGGAGYMFRREDRFRCACAEGTLLSAEGTLLSTENGFSAVVGASRVKNGSGKLMKRMYWVERRLARSSKI